MKQIEPNIYEYQTRKGTRYAARLVYNGRDHWAKGLLRKKDAADYLIDKRHEASLRRHLPHLLPAPTLDEYAETWIEQCTLRGIRPSTLRSYAQNLRDHIRPTLGPVPLDQITRQDIADLLQAKAKARQKDGTPKYSRNSLRLMLAPLSRLYGDAYDHGLIREHNPCLRPGRLFKVEKRAKDLAAMTLREERAFLKAAKRHRPDDYALCCVLFWAGLRFGEAIALEQRDVDVRRRRIRVLRNVGDDGQLYPTKTSRARQVEIARPLQAVLTRHVRSIKSGPLFPGVKGGYLNPRAWRRWVWDVIVEQAELSGWTPHSARHTYATRHLRAGCSLQWLSAQMGHSSIKVTVDTYGHLAQKP